MIGGSATEISSALAAMLRRALNDKTQRLPRWKEEFTQSWLLILNCYPLADDIAEVESALRRLVYENAELTGFDGILWSGYPDRTLIPISLEQKL